MFGLIAAAIGGYVQSQIQKYFGGISFDNYYHMSRKKKKSKGIALDRFKDIVDAHLTTDDIVVENGLNEEDSPYMSLDGYPNCYTQAYQEEYTRAIIKAELIAAATGVQMDPEDLMDMDRVEQDAYDYACQLADAWYGGDMWIPEDILMWAFYVVSDHNN